MVDLQVASVGRESSPWQCELRLMSSLLDGKSPVPSRRKEPGDERVGEERGKNHIHIHITSTCVIAIVVTLSSSTQIESECNTNSLILTNNKNSQEKFL